MNGMTEAEWRSVQTALCAGGLRECIDNLLASRFSAYVGDKVQISAENREIMERAWDDGDRTVILVANSHQPPWFIGTWDDVEVCEGIQHNGILYTAVPQSGGGLVSVVEGEGLVENDVGTIFHSMAEAKAYIQGRIA